MATEHKMAFQLNSVTDSKSVNNNDLEETSKKLDLSILCLMVCFGDDQQHKHKYVPLICELNIRNVLDRVWPLYISQMLHTISFTCPSDNTAIHSNQIPKIYLY